MTALGYCLAALLGLCLCGVCLVALFQKKRLKLQFSSLLATFSFEADEGPSQDK
jgi:hypothetical protein